MLIDHVSENTIAAFGENKQRYKVAYIPNQWSGTKPCLNKRTAETSPILYGKNAREARLSLQNKKKSPSTRDIRNLSLCGKSRG